MCSFKPGTRMEKELLEKIATNTSLRPTFQIVLTGVGSKLETSFSPPLDFHVGCKYEIALASLETYYSFPNIDASNNKFRVLIKDNWVDIKIPIGSYELIDINRETERQVVENGGKKEDICFMPNMNTLRCILILKKGVQVDMRGNESIRSVLGFKAKVYKEARTESEDSVNIMRVNSIFVHCSLINSSYVNGIQQPVIYSFFPSCVPGEKIIEKPNTLIYLPISLDVIPHMTAWVTDQNNTVLNLRGEKLTLKFHIRAC